MAPAWIGLLCAYDQTPLEEDDAVVQCAACGLYYHQECWAQQAGCASPACTAHRQTIGQPSVATVVSPPKPQSQSSTSNPKVLGFRQKIRGTLYCSQDGRNWTKEADDKSIVIILPTEAQVRLEVTYPCSPADRCGELVQDIFKDHHLDELRFDGIRIQSADVAALANIRNLRRIEFHGCRVTKRALRLLKDLPHLSELELDLPEIGWDSVFPLLTYYSFMISGANRRYFSFVTDLPRLKVLEVSRFVLTRKCLPLLGNLHELKTLNLSDNGFRSRDLEYISQLDQIEELDVSHNLLTGRSVHALHKMKRLRRLRLSDCMIGDNALLPANQWTELEVLDVSETPITTAALPYLRDLPRLSKLNLAHTSVGCQFHKEDGKKTHPRLRLLLMAMVPKLFWPPAIEEFICPSLLPLGFLALGECPVLKEVNLSHTLVGDTDLEFLSRSTTIQRLALNATHITDAGLIHIKQMRQLRMLEIAKTSVTSAGVLSLQAALPDCTILTREREKKGKWFDSQTGENLTGFLCCSCQTLLRKEDAVTWCKVCDSCYHSACWQKHDGCIQLACVSKRGYLTPGEGAYPARFEEGKNYCQNLEKEWEWQKEHPDV